MIKLLDRLIFARGALIYILFLSAGFGSVGKYPHVGWILVACAFFFVVMWAITHKLAMPKETKTLTLEDINGPDSIEEFLEQRRKS